MRSSLYLQPVLAIWGQARDVCAQHVLSSLDTPVALCANTKQTVLHGMAFVSGAICKILINLSAHPLQQSAATVC